MSDHSDDEFEPVYYSREEALRIAHAEAERAISELPESISYICYITDFRDYCFCEFVLEDGKWVKAIRCLTPEERMPGEAIRDESIRELAQSGNMVAAIRLYRSKHQVGLREAHDAIKSMLE
jgi:hypothetical protein